MKLKKLFLVSFVLGNTVLFAQNNKVEFTGAARSEMSQFGMTSDGAMKDTVTPGKRSGGYALIDLGFKINPNSSTEILGQIRVKNTFGGFWGSGVTFDVRQLYVKGVVANAFRYQLGNIDYKLTPFTFFNHNPDQMLPLTGVQKIKRDIIDYETFYTDKNTWRQQGAAVDFGLEFSKLIKEIKVNGFITRLNPTNGANMFERFYGGGNVILKQSKYFSLGVNHVSAFDLKGTATSTNVFRNNVSSVTYMFNLDKTNYIFGLSGESGMSTSGYSSDTTGGLSDYFVDLKASFNHVKSKLKVDVGYMDVGADFRSIGAQSKRVDFSRQNFIYDRYTNNQTLRPISTFDLNQNASLYNSSISEKIMDYNPAYNNALPYGKATFNRKGLYSTISISDKKEIIDAKVDAYLLSEIRGQGTFNLKKFTVVNTNVNFDISKLFKWKFQSKLMTGFSYQQTNRKSEYAFEQINLTSTQLNVGLEVEVIKQLFLMAGTNMFNTSGNELMPIRNANDEIYDFQEVHVNGKEMIYSAGLRFDFSKKIYLAMIYDQFSYNYNSTDPYKMNQFSIIYNMKF